MSGAPPRVLIVEDQVDLAENLFEFLGEEQYSLDFARDGLTALHLLASNDYDVVVLDIMLPGVSGYDICQRIRQDLSSNVPIIMVTARDSLEDKEKGFIGGADDYLVKPFALRELKLRIDALHRRSTATSTGLRAGAIAFQPQTLEVVFKGKTMLALSGLGARVFEALMRQYPGYCGHDSLVREVWGEAEVDPHTVRTQIYNLRKCLREHTGHPLIRTVHGHGYVIDPPSDNAS